MDIVTPLSANLALENQKIAGSQEGKEVQIIGGLSYRAVRKFNTDIALRIRID